ncbi:uncharacterized protein [Nicotiana tomentosiformis]|uniref:uncharacterized protein n=1 Tax=Nicotiana tomentosiformis TaxID=4098 RepID=UPI001447798F|nr:uncharacterized protein LOC117280014 [Nicotiana tomentosiformis]
MVNPSPNLNNQPENQTIFFIQPPIPQDHQPLSWIEQAVMGHAITFNMILDGQKTMIILHNLHFLAQLVSEGMHMAMSNYLNHIWLNNILHPLAPTMNANQAQAMRNHWNLPPHFNPLQPRNMTIDLPFFPPGEISNLNPIFIPWTTTPHHTQSQAHTPPPVNNAPPQAPNPNVPEPEGHQVGNVEEMNLVESGEIIEFSSLNEVKMYLFREMQEKRYILSCPPALYKCSMDIRPPQDPTVGSHAMILVPSLRRNPILHARMENGSTNNHAPMMYRPTNIIIWNIRGGNNDNFRVNFREMIDTHKPCMVTLLETRMENHISLLSDSPFSEMIEVPAEGQTGGMVIMWDASIVKVHNFVRRNQEIYATVEVVNALVEAPNF